MLGRFGVLSNKTLRYRDVPAFKVESHGGFESKACHVQSTFRTQTNRIVGEAKEQVLCLRAKEVYLIHTYSTRNHASKKGILDT